MGGSSRLAPPLAAILLGTSACEEPPIDFHPRPTGNWDMIVPSGFDQEAILKAARWRCGTAPLCQVFAYTDESYLKPDIPEDQRWSATVFTYSRNSNSGFEQIQWDCSIYPDTPEDQCRGEPTIDPELLREVNRGAPSPSP